jgi:hypothetical protein
MRSILGIVKSNNRSADAGARRSLREGLKALLVKRFPELDSIYCGSINVWLDEPLEICNDFHTPPIKWDAHFDPNWPPEVFRFQRIKFQYPEDGSVYDKAWIWRPSCNPILDELRIEILAEEVSGLKPDTRCRIHA